PLPYADPQATAWRLFEAIHQLITSLSEESADLLIWVDDINWADDTTITALSFVLDRWRGTAPVVLATARPESIHDNSPAVQLLVGFLSTGGRVDLEGLSSREAEDLIRRFGDANVPASLIDIISRWAGDNPLFMLELVAHLRDRAWEYDHDS